MPNMHAYESMLTNSRIQIRNFLSLYGHWANLHNNTHELQTSRFHKKN